jgi:hypothetical protein
VSPLKWALLVAGAGAIIGYVVWWYRTHEDPVRGRSWAAALRAAALLLAWLILLNPSLPAEERRRGEAVIALLDASYSMSRPADAGGGTIWSAAVDSVGRFDRAWLFGGPVARYLSTDSLPGEPLYGQTLLAPAIRSAAAAGAWRVVVYTDGALADAVESFDVAQRHGVSLSLLKLGSAYPELGIAGVSASAWVQAGDTAEVRVEIVASGVELDSVRVEVVDEDDRVRAAGWAEIPAAGRYSPLSLRFPVGGRAGYRRFSVRLAAAAPDPERRDDRRAFYIRVSEQPLGPVLISLRPDWEPSFLVPNLDRLTDAPTAAYLWLADSLVTMTEGYRPVALSTVQRRAREAPLLVLHGYGAESPAWARALAQDASRLLLLPAGRRGFELPGWNIRVGVPATGEWYASAQLPQSPLALDLGGTPVDELPPLLNVRSIETERAWEPLVVQRLRRGEPLPAVVVGRVGSRRWAVAAAEGYWRWAFRQGPGRQLYRALWTGVTGWLMAGRARSDAGLQPRQRVVARGEPLRWLAPDDADSLSVELAEDGSDVTWQGVAAAGDSLTAPLPPGRYRYLARAFHDGRVAASAEGPVEVEEFSPELLPPSGVSLGEMVTASPGEPRRGGTGRSRPLAALGWPYLILIALFCAEWTVRRLGGLR